jgi:hypothetical protein
VDEIYNQEDVSFLVGYLSMGALFFYGSVVIVVEFIFYKNILK